MTKGERIKEIRFNLGMSQTDFADKIGVSKQTLYKYENDIITNIPSDKIENIAKLGNILPSYIMGWEDEPQTSLQNDMGKRIRELRSKNNMTLEEVANGVGVGKSTVRKWETGIIANMRRDKIAALAKTLHTTPAYLMGWEDEPQTPPHADLKPATKRRYKYLGEIACGEPIFANEEYETYIDLDTDIKADFVLKAKGDSMINARIFDGDIVFIHEQPDVNDGEIAAVIIDDEATLKRVYKYEDHISLNAENPIYKPIQVRYNDGKNIRIIGRAIAATIQLK